MIKKQGYYTFKAIPWAFIVSFVFLLPIVFIFGKAFGNNAEEVKRVFTSSYTYRILLFTVEEAFLSAFLSVILALPFAAFFSHYRFPGRSTILSLSQLSFTIPSILVVLGFVMWYGNNGVLNNTLMKLLNLNEPPLRILYSFKAIILAHVYFNFPIAFALITTSWTCLERREELASYSLGKSRFYTFWKVTLPRLRLSIISSFIMIFLFCFSSFVIVMVLGGKPQYYTLEAEIYRRTNIEVNPASSAALSLFVFLITSLLLVMSSYGGGTRTKAIRKENLKSARKGKMFLAILLSFLILSFILPPIFTILYRSFFLKNGSLSFDAWRSLGSSQAGLQSGVEAVINSMIIALISAFLCIQAATAIAVHASKNSSKLIMTISSMPMATGSVTLGLGFSFVASYIANEYFWLSYLMIIIAHFIIALPFAVRTLYPGTKELSQSITLSSYSLGASARKTFLKVENPLLLPYKIKAFSFAFALSLGEVNATLTMAGGKVITLPVLIYRLVGKYNYQAASALGTILLAEAFLIFILGEIGGKGVKAGIN